MAESNATMTPFIERMPRPPLVENNRSMHWVTNLIAGGVERKTPLWWWIAIAVTGSFAGFGVFCIIYLLWTGVGVWGNNIPIGWAWDITNFVFWIGIGHAGTLISAILFLTRQKWRTSINRSSEAMTLVCRDLRRNLSGDSRWPHLDGLVHGASAGAELDLA